MKQLYSIIFILGAFFTMTSCSDWLDVSPETEKKQEDMFSTETGYKNVLTGAYIRMKSTSLYGEEMVHGTLSMLAQNWNNTTTGSKEAYLRLYDYKAAQIESTFSSIYNNLYKVIADVNGLLKDIDANREVFKGNNYELIKAEALAIRAFCHFDILRLFGPMPTQLPSEAILPYVKTVSTTPNSKITYEQFTKNLLDDLQEAEDLFQIGVIGLMKAVDKFDLSYEVMFSTYAVPMIMGEIRRFLRDDGMVKVSRTLKENGYKISKARELLTNELGREPSILEIEVLTELSREEIVLAMEANRDVESIYQPVAGTDGDEILLVDQLGNTDSIYEEPEKEAVLNELVVAQLLATLDEKERQIIRLRYFENKTQCEVAVALGMSQVQISRLERKILLRLREQFM